MNDIKKDFIRMYAEIEFNADNDTLFERITLKRLQDFSDKYFGTNLYENIIDESREAREYLLNHSEDEWRKVIRKKRIKELKVHG